MRLDEITATWSAFDEALAAAGGELTPEAEAALDALNLAEREKVDAYVFRLKMLEGESGSLKAMEEELCAKRTRLDAQWEFLRGRVRGHMKARGVEELKGLVYRFKLQKAGGKPGLELKVPPEQLPEDLVTKVIKPDDAKIRAAIAAGRLSDQVAVLKSPGLTLRVY